MIKSWVLPWTAVSETGVTKFYLQRIILGWIESAWVELRQLDERELKSLESERRQCKSGWRRKSSVKDTRCGSKKRAHLSSRSVWSGSLTEQWCLSLSVRCGPENGHHSLSSVLDGCCGSAGFELAFEEWQRGDLAELFIYSPSFGYSPLRFVSWTVLFSSVFMV